MDEYEHNRDTLYRLVLGLARRCRKQIHLGLMRAGRKRLRITRHAAARDPDGLAAVQGVQRMNTEPLFSIDRLRPSQQDVVVGYQGGRMGISAVPGSGKTYTLSFLAADIILGGNLDLDQEVLIVTMSNSAVDNFSQRIGGSDQERRLLPGMGYRVRTLHGLAHDIVRERPGLVNLANDFSIIDEGEASEIREQVALAWLRANPDFFDEYLNPDLSEYQLDKRAQQGPASPGPKYCAGLIRYAKDRELTPEALRKRLR